MPKKQAVQHGLPRRRPPGPIAWDWSADSFVCFMDLETYSHADLTKRGVFDYIQDGSTGIRSAVFHVPGEKPVIWVPSPPKRLDFPGMVTGIEVPEQVKFLARHYTWVAHNAEGFDALVWSALFPHVPAKWRDTQPMARILGLPGSLDKLSKWFGGTGKDAAGTKAMHMLRKPDVIGTPPLWKKFLQYNLDDVLQLEQIYGHLEEVLDTPHAKFLAVHSRINDRGIRANPKTVVGLIRHWTTSKAQAADTIAELTGGALTTDKVRSGPATHNWLASQGVKLKNLRRAEVEAVLADPDLLEGASDLALVHAVLTERSHVVRTGEAKLDRLLHSILASRLRYWAVYNGAGTGRYSSRGTQLHNMPRGDGSLDVKTLLAILEAGGDIDYNKVPVFNKKGEREYDKRDPGTVLNTLLRSAFVADEGEELGIIDYAAIEARGVAWMSRDQKMLDAYYNDADIYVDMASDVFGRKITKADTKERFVGKQIILGAGYGMSGEKFEIVCRLQKVDLAAVGLTGEQCIKAYRKRYDKVPVLWKNMGTAAMNTVKTGRTHEAGRCTFNMLDQALVLTLPSGRNIYYRNAQVVKRVPMWSIIKGKPVPPQDTIIYTHPHGHEKVLYGALILENANQANSLDLMQDALYRIDQAGKKIVVHVHDEVVYSAPRHELELDKVASIMKSPPEWAEGFPVGVEGFSCPVYSKSPWKGESQHAK